MAKASALVITKNVERYIAGCLQGLTWADEIVVLDSMSTDRTVEIAREFTAKVFQHEFVSFPRTRNAALDLAQNDWVFFLDADEIATPELATEIREVLSAESIAHVGYWIPRKNLILGKWIQHTGWYPDHQLRLLRRDCVRYDEQFSPHEVASLQGSSGYLTNHIIHHNYETLGQLVYKQNRYSSQEALFLHQRGTRAKPQNFILQPLREFNRRYFVLQGYRDGMPGLLLSLFMAFYNFVMYVKLARLK